MVGARILVGIVAAGICLAGVAWYAVYLFASNPRRPGAGLTLPAAKLHPKYEQRQKRRTIVLGVVAVIGSLALIPETLDSIRTGIPIHTPHGPDVNGRIAFLAILFLAVMALSIVASGLRIGNAQKGPADR